MSYENRENDTQIEYQNVSTIEESSKKPLGSKLSLFLSILIPFQIFIFFLFLFWSYKTHRINPELQETIQGSVIEQLVGPQVIDLANNEGDPRISWFDPGATLFFKGFVNSVDENKISLVASDQNAYDIPLAKDRSIACMKELKSACPCTDDCTLEHVEGSISVSVRNYYESVDMPNGTVEDQIVFSSIFIE